MARKNESEQAPPSAKSAAALKSLRVNIDKLDLQILKLVNELSFCTTWFASEFVARRARRRVEERTEIATSGFATVLVELTEEVPPEIDFVEIRPRSAPEDIPAACAAVSIASSEWTIAPTVAGFVCGPWSSVPPMTLYG